VWPKAENQLMRPSSLCTDEHGQTIYANLDNAITLFRDEFGIEARSSHLRQATSW
jgi:hypothetical protein